MTSSRPSQGRAVFAASPSHPSKDQSLPWLSWWRTLPADALGPRHRAVLAALLATITPLRVPSWSEVATGDAAATVAAALHHLTYAIISPPGDHDPVMSAVLRCALEGDGASTDLLVHVLTRRSRRGCPHAAGLARSWRRQAGGAAGEGAL